MKKKLTDDEICNVIYDNVKIKYKENTILNMRMFALIEEDGIPTIMSIVTYFKDNQIREKTFKNKLFNPGGDVK